MLPENLNDIEVSLIDSERNQQWSASVSREGKRLKQESRLRPLYIEINNPLQLNPPLLSGTFLNVQIQGRSIEDLLKIPESAYTKTGCIWFIKDNKIQSIKVEPMFRANNNIFIKRPENISLPLIIASAPNSAFLDGMTVTAESIKGDNL